MDYRRGKYLEDYVTKNLSDDEIQKYYDENVFGDINTQHVLVEVSTSEDDGKLSDADAKTLAEEIIDKLNDGTSWEEIQKQYKDKITYEDLGYQAWDASLEESFLTALKEMEDNNELEIIKTKRFDRDMTKYLPLIEPNLDLLSARELEHIDKILAKHSDKSAKELSEFVFDKNVKKGFEDFCKHFFS